MAGCVNNTEADGLARHGKTVYDADGSGGCSKHPPGPDHNNLSERLPMADGTIPEPRPLVSRDDARAAGLKRFYTGRPCVRGHYAERFVSSKGCIACLAEHNKSWNEANPGRARQLALARDPLLLQKQRDKMRQKRPVATCKHCGTKIDFPDAPPEGCVKIRRQSYCSLECRYWSWVIRRADDECWGWKGTKHRFGYGMISISGRKKPDVVTAHALSWKIANGRDVPKGMVIMHSCDNPECTNPAHLSVGTHRDNIDDKVRKDRQSRGATNGGAKLSDEQVIQIRNDPRPQATIAAEHGVSQQLVSRIRRRLMWKHLP
jgi:hypothetical protein